MAGDYGVLAVAVCVCVYTMYVSCYLYYKIKTDMMGMLSRKKMGAVCHVCDACPVLPGPRPREQTHTAIYAHTRVVHTHTCSPAANGLSYCMITD